MQIKKCLAFNLLCFVIISCTNSVMLLLFPHSHQNTSHISHFSEHLTAKIKWGTKRCQINKTSSHLFFPAASASPCCIKVWLFISLFMCVKHHHESWLFSNKHYIQKRRVASLQTFILNNNLHVFNFLSSRLLPFRRSNIDRNASWDWSVHSMSLNIQLFACYSIRLTQFVF